MNYEDDIEFIDLLTKRQSPAQRIDDKGVAIFNAILTRTSKLSLPFNKQDSNDFGIDGEIQVLEDAKNTGEKYKVQIKSSEHVKYIRGNSIVSFSLDVRSAYSLLRIEKVPVVLIIVDVITSRVFWSAIQIDETVAKSLAKTLEAKKKYAKRKKLTKEKQKELLENASITVHIPIENEVTSDRYEPLLDALRKSNVSVSKRTIIATRGVSLMEGMKNLSDMEADIKQLQGFDIVRRPHHIFADNRAVMSLGNGRGEAFDLIPNKDYMPGLAPRITLKGNLDKSKSRDGKVIEDFNRLLRGEDATVVLKGSQIKSLVIQSGDDIIDEIIGSKNATLTISPYVERRDIDLIISNGYEELTLEGAVAKKSNEVVIETNSGSALSVKISIETERLKDTNASVQCDTTFGIKSKNITSIPHYIRLMDFVRKAESVTIGFVREDGFRESLFKGKGLDRALKVTDDFYKIVTMLSEIEKITGHNINLPLPDRITSQQLTELRRNKDIITTGWSAGEAATMSFDINENIPGGVEKLNKGDAIRIVYDDASFTVLGQVFEMPEYKKVIQGKLDKVVRTEDQKHQYRIHFDEVTVSLLSKSTDNNLVM